MSYLKPLLFPQYRLYNPPKSKVQVNYLNEFCNQTWDHLTTGTFVDLELPTIPPSHIGKKYYCWFRFEVASNQKLDIRVNRMNSGYYDVSSKSCQLGYLSINEGPNKNLARWPLPTTVCGNYEDMNTRKVTYGHSAFVEYYAENLQSENALNVRVLVINKRNSTRTPTFGATTDGNGKVENTNCDWTINVGECYGYCKLHSPGYPGIYPPNTRCKYLLTNEKLERIQLELGGKGMAGYFDIEPSGGCQEDRLSVYDGAATSSPLIGRYCGHEAPRIISQGPAILAVFESGPGGPDWDFNGFSVRIHDRWSDNHAGGQRLQGSLCSWTFTSAELEDKRGDAHTPDYRLPPNTTCDFIYMISNDERMEITLIFYSLKDSCQEYVEVVDGSHHVVDKICSDRVRRRRQELKFNSTKSQVTIRYVNRVGQTSNAEPVWIYYAYKSASSVTDRPTDNTRHTIDPGHTVPSHDKTDGPAKSKVSDIGESKGRGGSTTLTASVLILTVCWIIHVQTV